MVPNPPETCRKETFSEPLVVTVNEGARLLSISRRKMCYLLADGVIPSFLIGKRRFIALADLKAFIARSAA